MCRTMAVYLLLPALLLAPGWLAADQTADGAAAFPKVMVIIQEKVMGVLGTTGFESPGQAELTLVRHLRELGFPVVDPQIVRRNVVQARGLRLLEGDDQAAAAVGLQHGAQLVVIGTAISKPAGGKLYETQLQSIHATLSVRVVNNDDARVIASASAQATRAHIDEVKGGVLAIEEAAGKIADELGATILAAWQGARDAPREVSVNLSGLVSYRHLDFILLFFERDVPGIKQVKLHSFTAGVADLGLTYQGRTQDLARRIATRKFTGFRLEPISVTANRIDLRALLDKK